jgi:magnesium-transporting ATPase (P-type)
MTKHILGQAIYQIAVICVFLFLGDKFLPSGYSDDPSLPWDLFQPGKNYEDQYPDWQKYAKENKDGAHKITNHDPATGLIRTGLEIRGYNDLRYSSSVHYTYCFNVFVMMTFFNKFNARKLEDQFFILSGLFRSAFYFPILMSILVLQILIVTFTGYAFRCAPGVRIFKEKGFKSLGTQNYSLVGFCWIRSCFHDLQTYFVVDS